MNSPCFEQTRLSREATTAKKETREAITALNSQAISPNNLPSKSDNLGRPLQPKRNPSRPPQPKYSLTPTASTNRMRKKTDNLEATAATFYQGEKAIQVNKTKTKFELVTNDKTKMTQFILRCHRTAPLCVIWS